MSSNSWLERRIVNFGHQGGSFEAPSSTLYAIEQGIRSGASAIELDVHATADQVLVVCHDETVDRTTNETGRISELTMSELEQLDNAYWFIQGEQVSLGHDADDYLLRGLAPTDRNYGVARLDEVMASFPGVVLNLDIKRTAPDVVPYEALLAKILDDHHRDDDVIVASFLDSAIQAFRSLRPTTATSAATLETATFYRALQNGEELPGLDVVAFQVPETYGDLTLVDQQFVDGAHSAGIAVHVWTINERDAMKRLVGIGVDGIISDCPTLLSEVLGDTAWDGVR